MLLSHSTASRAPVCKYRRTKAPVTGILSGQDCGLYRSSSQGTIKLHHWSACLSSSVLSSCLLKKARRCWATSRALRRHRLYYASESDPQIQGEACWIHLNLGGMCGEKWAQSLPAKENSAGKRKDSAQKKSSLFILFQHTAESVTDMLKNEKYSVSSHVKLISRLTHGPSAHSVCSFKPSTWNGTATFTHLGSLQPEESDESPLVSPSHCSQFFTHPAATMENTQALKLHIY